MWQLGVWSHPEYLLLKATKTTPMDVQEVMPMCISTISFHFFNTSLLHVLIHYFRMFEADSKPPDIPI